MKAFLGNYSCAFTAQAVAAQFPCSAGRASVAAGACGATSHRLNGLWAAAWTSVWARMAAEALRDAPAVAAELRGRVAAEVWLTSRRSIPILLYWRLLPALPAGMS